MNPIQPYSPDTSFITIHLSIDVGLTVRELGVASGTYSLEHLLEQEFKSILQSYILVF